MTDDLVPEKPCALCKHMTPLYDQLCVYCVKELYSVLTGAVLWRMYVIEEKYEPASHTHAVAAYMEYQQSSGVRGDVTQHLPVRRDGTA